jgi:hypothetical protein
MSRAMNSCCLSGFLNDGATPVGEEDIVNGLPCYISKPKDGSKARTVIFVSDIFGYKTPNVRLLADEYAKEGFYAYVPDFYGGDALPYSFLQSVEPPLKKREQLSLISKTKNSATVVVTLGPWVIKHRESVAKQAGLQNDYPRFYASAAHLLFVLHHHSISRYNLSGQCKLVPGDAKWPPESEWEAMNDKIHGQLLNPSPLAALCHV